jgi:hypothetical protein
MLIKFSDLASASLYATKKNDEGYYAEILHLHSGHLYGPLPTMGFMVLVSEYAADDGDEVPEMNVSIPKFLHYIGLFLCLFSLIVVGLAFLYLAWMIIWLLIGLLLSDITSFMLLCLFLFAAFALLSIYVMGLMKMIPVLREGTKITHEIFRIIIVSFMILIVILW